MTAHEESVRQAHDALRGKTYSNEHTANMEFVSAYLAAMLERGWKMTPREPVNLQIDRAIGRDSYWSINAIPRVKAAYQTMWDSAPTSGTER